MKFRKLDWCPNAKVYSYTYETGAGEVVWQYTKDDLMRNRFFAPFPARMWLK